MGTDVQSCFTEPGGPREFLTFMLGKEDYALDILKVQEIRGYEAPTRIANSPSFIKGVIDLRGDIVPIIDMRIKFNAQDVQYIETTVVIILNLGNRVVGIVVDSVSDVISLAEGDIRPAPEFAATVGSRFVQGLATVDQRMLIITDIEAIMRAPDMCLTDTTNSLAE